MSNLKTLVLHLRRTTAAEEGQTLVEYALLLSLLAVALIAVMYNFSSGVNGLYGVIQAVVDAIAGS